MYVFLTLAGLLAVLARSDDGGVPTDPGPCDAAFELRTDPRHAREGSGERPDAGLVKRLRVIDLETGDHRRWSPPDDSSYFSATSPRLH